MAALIEYVCTAPHDRRQAPSVTVEHGAWAYCSCGAGDGHQWTRIDPTTIEVLRLRAGDALTRLVPHEAHEPTTTN